ncbi:hypothetical protein ID866_2211 [Astraeus odoratus]|nr:hypothetical protein ID866_2211 [Astraeus odoratus]
MMATTTLKVGVVQFAPKVRVQANIAKAQELCKGIAPRSVDLLCFPEMVFSGYVFPDAASISPYLEHPRTGPTSAFCAELSRRLECYVAAGFPERLERHTPQTSTVAVITSLRKRSATTPQHPRLVGANSAVLYGPTGELVTLYRKSNLFETDLTWAAPGSGLTVLDLPLPLGKTTIAICNDLNVRKPAEWDSLEDGPYELADHCIREGTRVLVLLNAWLRSKEDGSENDGDDESDSMDPDWTVLRWWATRLRPTWKPEKKATEKDPQKLVVVICNRFGHEGDSASGKTFAGSSSMFLMRRGSGAPQLLNVMGKREEGVSIWTVPVNIQP